MRVLAVALVLVPLALFVSTHRDRLAPTAFGSRWAVVSAHPFATEAGAAILAAGGTAADAAVAVSMALAVVYPQAGNIGGGMFAVGYDAKSGRTYMIDGREAAPAAVTRGTFLSLPATAAVSGPYAAGVPGTVAALAALHAKHGKLPWSALVAPAIRLADDGHPLTPKSARMLLVFRRLLAGDAGSRAQFFAVDPVTGAVLKQPALAATLARLAKDPQDFYRGETARLLVADARAYGSPLTAGDLTAYRAHWREPVRCKYRGFDIVSAAPPSSGGAILCETAQILAPFELSSLAPTGPSAVHLTLQAWGQSFRDRARLGDPDFVDNGVEELIRPAYGARIAGRIRLDAAGLVTASTVPAGKPEPLETTHFSIIDAAGNAVAMTTTLNGPFGNGHTVRGAGFLLNNEMDDFNTRPGAPNLYGLVQGEANTPAPGKRMLSSMSPTLVFRNGKLLVVTGTPGGSTIPTTVWQVLTYLIDHRWVLDRAVAQPRYHYQDQPDVVFHEKGAFTPATQARLEGLGYKFKLRERATGDVQAIAWNTGRKMWMAVGDPRGEGTAAAR